VETVEYRHGAARPGHLSTHMSELADGPVKPGHDEKWAISNADIAILAPIGPGPAISQREILSLNRENRSYREIGLSPGMTNSGQSGVSVAAAVG
jgi:hypothetical protein